MTVIVMMFARWGVLGKERVVNIFWLESLSYGACVVTLVMFAGRQVDGDEECDDGCGDIDVGITGVKVVNVFV